MKTVYLFNPENDLALAANAPYFTSPKLPRLMARDLASLPRWYGSATKSTYSEDEKIDWLSSEELHRRATWGDRDGNPYGFQHDDFADCQLSPWGWNESLRTEALKANFPENNMHKSHEINTLRQISNRATAVTILEKLRAELIGENVCGCSQVCRSLAEIEAFHKLHPQMLLKAPWSCSGRGLYPITLPHLTPQIRAWAIGLIASQGSVIAEELQEKVLDFAIEFIYKKEVLFAGYSVFETDNRGSYIGNRLATDAELEGIICQHIPRPLLNRTKELLSQLLTEQLQGTVFSGYLGVDMLVNSKGLLLPCVEINLRMNMGMVAHKVYERLFAQGTNGLFRVDYFPTNSALLANHEEESLLHPTSFDEANRLVSGYYPLTPIGDKTQYRAAVWASKHCNIT